MSVNAPGRNLPVSPRCPGFTIYTHEFQLSEFTRLAKYQRWPLWTKLDWQLDTEIPISETKPQRSHVHLSSVRKSVCFFKRVVLFFCGKQNPDKNPPPVFERNQDVVRFQVTKNHLGRDCSKQGSQAFWFWPSQKLRWNQKMFFFWKHQISSSLLGFWGVVCSDSGRWIIYLVHACHM